MAIDWGRDLGLGDRVPRPVVYLARRDPLLSARAASDQQTARVVLLVPVVTEQMNVKFRQRAIPIARTNGEVLGGPTLRADHGLDWDDRHGGVKAITHGD